eukprot:scaffold696_cov107-Isochrysis_galbana.AAC.2
MCAPGGRQLVRAEHLTCGESERKTQGQQAPLLPIHRTKGVIEGRGVGARRRQPGRRYGVLTRGKAGRKRRRPALTLRASLCKAELVCGASPIRLAAPVSAHRIPAARRRLAVHHPPPSAHLPRRHGADR